MDLTGLNELTAFNECSSLTSSPTRASISIPVQPPPPQQQQQQQQQAQQSIQNAPPLPPRANQINTYGQQTYGVTNPLQYSSYSNTIGPSIYHNYSPISSSIYSPYTQSSSVMANNNSFVRAAEESTRGAFQSIESVVQAFSAVSAMFESTYYAVFNSFRAVVGVADQFYRLKTHLSGIVSAFALFKFFKYIYRRLLRILRVAASIVTNKSASSQAEQDAWSMANGLSDTEKFVKSGGSRQTNWPLVMFLAVVFGGPWLIWKILSSINNKDDNLWMQGKIDHFIGVAEFDFDAVNNDEISFRRGQKIIIAPKEYQPRVRGWLLGTVDGQTQGIMPANYLKILGKKSGENTVKAE